MALKGLASGSTAVSAGFNSGSDPVPMNNVSTAVKSSYPSLSASLAQPMSMGKKPKLTL